MTVASLHSILAIHHASPPPTTGLMPGLRIANPLSLVPGAPESPQRCIASLRTLHKDQPLDRLLDAPLPRLHSPRTHEPARRARRADMELLASNPRRTQARDKPRRQHRLPIRAVPLPRIIHHQHAECRDPRLRRTLRF